MDSTVMTPKKSQANISSFHYKTSAPPQFPHVSDIVPQTSAAVCSWQDANLLQILPEGMDRRSRLYCTMENNNSSLLDIHKSRYKGRLTNTEILLKKMFLSLLTLSCS